jgi:plasmid stabilization system protein ParE
MAEVIWTVRAYEHLFQIGEYIIKDSPFQAKRVIQLIIKETQRLENSTRVGHN